MIHVRTMLAGGAIALATGAVAAIGWLWIQPTPPSATPSTTPSATAEVTRGPLFDTKTVTGTLGYGELSALRPALADDSAMVTWIAAVGTTVERGEPLYALDGHPAILFYGTVPQHRTLRFDPEVDRPVWVELEQAEVAVEAAELVLALESERLADAEARVSDATARLEDALSSVPVTAEFIQLTGAVTAAEAKLARARELSAAQLTPVVEVAAAESTLAAARAALDAAIRALRQDIAAARLDSVTARAAAAEAGVMLDERRTALGALASAASGDTDVQQIAENLAALGYEGRLADQVRAWQHDAGLPVTGIVGPNHVAVAPGPVHIAAHSASVGETLLGSSPDRGSLLDYSSIDKLVTVPLDVGDQGLAGLGRTVLVTLPDDTEVEGTISEIGSVVNDGAIEIIVTIADQAALHSLEVASVDVEFVSDGREDVLSVPIAALLALPGGGAALEVVASGTATVVPVDTGLFAAGRVEVAGAGIAEGALVGVPQ